MPYKSRRWDRAPVLCRAGRAPPPRWGGRRTNAGESGRRALYNVKRHFSCDVGQTIAFRGLSCLTKGRLVDRRQKTIVCPTWSLPQTERHHTVEGQEALRWLGGAA